MDFHFKALVFNIGFSLSLYAYLFLESVFQISELAFSFVCYLLEFNHSHYLSTYNTRSSQQRLES